jgi:alpha-beta hydrolase superfamily lysophospholipase
MPAGRSLLSIAFAPVIGSLMIGVLRSDEPASQTFDAKGVKVHYLIAGKGDTVVLIHGLYASAEINWRRPGIFDALSRNHQVVALDLPGHGRSDKPDTGESYGLQLVEDVVLLLDHLNVTKAHLVGYSLGGMVAAQVAAQHPDRILSVTLGGMGWFREGSGLQRMWEKMPAWNVASTPSALVQNIGKLALTEQQIKGIGVPVKVVIGDLDPVRRMCVLPLQQVRKDWDVVDIKGAGHITCIFNKEFREAIVAWVDANSK